jgi:type II restriction endonuclease TdeIII
VTPEVRSIVHDLVASFMEHWIADAIPGDELAQISRDGVSPSGLLAPFHDALVPGIMLLRERSFSTRLGNLHERVAVAVALSEHAEAQRAFDLSGSMPSLAREFISQRLHALEARQVEPDVVTERAGLLNAFGQSVTDSTRIDLRIVTRSGEEHFFEMKSGKPNKGQCLEMKERLMKAVAIRQSPRAWAWWGVPYDPYGEGAYAHPYPGRFFDFANEVKLGRSFWNFVGGNSTYDELLDIYSLVGETFSERLRSLLTRP